VDKSFIGQEQSNSFSLQEVHLEQLDTFICSLRDSILMYVTQATTFSNIGLGAELYKQTNGAGIKELRTIVSENNSFLDVIENSDTVGIRAGVPSMTLDSNSDVLSLIMTTLSETLTLNSIDLSKYALNTFVQQINFNNTTKVLTVTRNNLEPDITVDLSFLGNNLQAVSFNSSTNNLEFQLADTLVTINRNDFLNTASETDQGVIEIATQSEVNAGADDQRAITPAKLSNYVSNPINLPNSTELQRGVAEIATQSEVNAGVDDEKIVTSAKLDFLINNSVNNIVTTYLNTININPIVNTGTISSIDPGAGTINSAYTVSGDIFSAILEDISGASARILVTLTNPMSNTTYVVKSFHESLGDINVDDNLAVSTFKPISTTQFRISISDPLGGAQSLRLHLDVEQR